MFNIKNNYFSEATFPVLILPEREKYKNICNLLNIGTDLDSPITLLIWAQQPSEKCWWSWTWTAMFFQLTAFEWRHSWPNTSFSGQSFYMQSNKCNLWSKSNVTILRYFILTQTSFNTAVLYKTTLGRFQTDLLLSFWLWHSWGLWSAQ